MKNKFKKDSKNIFLLIFIGVVVLFVIRGIISYFEDKIELQDSQTATAYVLRVYYDDDPGYRKDRMMELFYFAKNRPYTKSVPYDKSKVNENNYIQIKFANADPSNIELIKPKNNSPYHRKICVYGEIEINNESEPKVDVIDAEGNKTKLNIIKNNFLFYAKINTKYTFVFSAKNCGTKILLLDTRNYQFDKDLDFAECEVNPKLLAGSSIDTSGRLLYSEIEGQMVFEKYN